MRRFASPYAWQIRVPLSCYPPGSWRGMGWLWLRANYDSTVSFCEVVSYARGQFAIGELRTFEREEMPTLGC